MGITPGSGHQTQDIESWLLEAGLVDSKAIAEAKKRSAETGERLIDALFAAGALSPRDVKVLLQSKEEPARIECAQIGELIQSSQNLSTITVNFTEESTG